MTLRILASVLYASLLGLWAANAPAQVIYKSTMPDGRVIYGSEPAPGRNQ